jgi:hypothetical protein
MTAESLGDVRSAVIDRRYSSNSAQTGA